MNRKRPEGVEWDSFKESWSSNNHLGKVSLCETYGISYDMGKHWYSDFSKTEIPKVFTDAFPDSISSPLTLKIKEGVKTIAVLGDFHFPYHDIRVINEVCKFLNQEVNPDYLIYNGDIVDFYQVSDFAKDPKRLGQLQEDIDIAKNYFQQFNDALPNTQKILLDGTHEFRWEKYLQKHAPAVAGLNCLTIEQLYGLKEFNIGHIGYERGLLINEVFLILHGDIAQSSSAYTAKAHLDKKGGSGICNHTHRLGSCFKRDRFGTRAWWENGCLCTLNPDWLQNPDWQQGFSLLHFSSSNRFWVEQIPIIDKKFMYGGKVFANK